MNKKETTYQSPEVEVINICAESIICASGPDSSDAGIYNPWIFDKEEV